MQETLTKLFTKWPKINHVENLDAYVNTMLVRVFLDERRRGWWKVALLDWLPERPAPAPSLDDRSADLVVVLRYLCDLPVRDVAQHLGCSEGTVKSQCAHALDRLRATFDTTFAVADVPFPVFPVAQDRR